MSVSSFVRYALIGCIAATPISGCGGSQPPIAQSDMNAQVNPIASVPAQRQDLLYVADSDGVVEIVSYPAEEKVRSFDYGLYSYLEGECADRSGNVWISDYDLIEEYPHGATKPIWEKSAKWYLTGCSIAPKTSDVAAVGQQGTIFVWSSGGARAKTYHTKASYTLRYCGYDADGDLFVDGSDLNNNDKFVLFELPSGGKKLSSVSVNVKIRGAGQVQWDGRYLAIQDSDAPYDIYQIKVSSYAGSVVNTVTFEGLRATVKASWIARSLVFVPYSVSGKFADAIGVFNYPGGGKPISILQGKTYQYVTAVTLSR